MISTVISCFVSYNGEWFLVTLGELNWVMELAG
jgi:hypothetical protein